MKSDQHADAARTAYSDKPPVQALNFPAFARAVFSMEGQIEFEQPAKPFVCPVTEFGDPADYEPKTTDSLVQHASARP